MSAQAGGVPLRLIRLTSFATGTDEAPDLPTAIRIHALGAFRAVGPAGPIARWGGAKAGRRQALALFAFLHDRGELGVAKDDAIELIWPETELERADLAFHRTLGGLRRVLAPGWEKEAIAFGGDRYRLDPRLVAWSDADEFAWLCETTERSMPDYMHRLERARDLYRGNYMDDCPIYGDCAAVEPRRARLRQYAVDALHDLADAYEARGDRRLAAVRRSEADFLLSPA